jgi:hypothetical protein
MNDITKARKLFREAGLGFPTIPADLAPQLKERDRWVFSTRPIREWPYDLDYYVHEVQKKQVPDYALLAHSGHGVNSYAIQYYLVHGSLRMFLHLGWGGVYGDKEKDVATIRACFSKADKIVQAMVQGAAGFQTGEYLTVVGSDFYGSYWSPPGASRGRKEVKPNDVSPPEMLTEVLDWLTSRLLHPGSLGTSMSNQVERGAIATSRKLKSLRDNSRSSRSRLATNTTKEQGAEMGKKRSARELQRIEKMMMEGEVVSIEPITKGDTATLPTGVSVVTKENVEKALDEIDSGGSHGVPKKRKSTIYCLETRGRHYPPKYVLFRARKIQGTKRHGFRGGPRTNNQLQNLGRVIKLAR